MHGASTSRAVAAVLLALAAACAREAPLVSRPPGAPRSVVVRNVRVFDAPRATLAEGLRDVLVRDGRIDAVGPPGLPARDIPEIDGRGGTLLPGLVDVHTHTGSSSYPPWRVVFPDVARDAGPCRAIDLRRAHAEVLDLPVNRARPPRLERWTRRFRSQIRLKETGGRLLRLQDGIPTPRLGNREVKTRPVHRG